MKLFKPGWVSHDGQPIFSIDIHPDGSRFATGGLGDGGSSGKVYIWNMTPVMNPKDENDKNIPKILCVMDNHLACVNSVRWSCNGRYLASGGDDRLIMIWQFAGYGGVGVFGDAPIETSTGERWRCTHTLKGHTGDVLDLAWSPGNQWLASCSIDNTVVIWNAEKFPEITSVLKGHTSLVKGVTWDPIGSYLASQSDDKTVKIWKTLDWKLEMTVTEPFAECTATTHVLRLSWSPDGGYLVSAHAMNNSGPTAQIIQRDGWKTDMDFVGHRKAITCTRFNGCVFSNLDERKQKAGEESKKTHTLPYTCCAVGSRDRSLSVWLTSLRRPLVVVHDLFEDSVMDISWSFSGYNLLCCSWDGTVAYIELKESEIGKTLTQEEKNKLHRDTYGKTSCVVQQPLIIENPAMLAIQQKKSGAGITQDDSAAKPPTLPQNYPTKQIETRTATGQRRIIPVFVAPQEALGGIPRPFGSSTNFGRPPSAANLPKLSEKSPNENKVVESEKVSLSKSSQDDERSSPQKPPPVEEEVSNKRSDATDATTPKKPSGEAAVQKKKAVLDCRLSEKSTETSKSDVVKSVQFASLTSIKTPENKTSQELVTSVPAPLRAPTTTTTAMPSPRRPGRPSLQLKRKMNAPTSPRKKQYKSVRKDQTKGVPMPREKGSHEKHPSSEETPHVGARAVFGQSRLSEHPSLPAKKLARKVSVQDSSTPPLVVTIDNELTSDDRPAPLSMHKVSCSCGKEERWSTVISSPAVTAHVSQHIVGIACQDRSLHILSSTSGRKLLPPLCSASLIAQLRCKGHHLMAIDTCCQLSVWNLKSCTSSISDCSFGHLMVHERGGDWPTLKKCALSDHGIPVLTLSNGKTFTYSVDLRTWVLVRSPHDSVEQFSESVAMTTDDHVTSSEDDVLSLVKKMTNGMGAHATRSFHTNPTWQRNATLASLEAKLASCVVLQSVADYRKCLLAYVRLLVQENLELRLREICSDLIGPSSRRPWVKAGHGVPGTWKSHVLGICKESLLQDEVLPIIGSNLAFQRLYTEYQDLLDSKRSRPRFPMTNGDV